MHACIHTYNRPCCLPLHTSRSVLVNACDLCLESLLPEVASDHGYVGLGQVVGRDWVGPPVVRAQPLGLAVGREAGLEHAVAGDLGHVRDGQGPEHPIGKGNGNGKGQVRAVIVSRVGLPTCRWRTPAIGKLIERKIKGLVS